MFIKIGSVHFEPAEIAAFNLDAGITSGEQTRPRVVVQFRSGVITDFDGEEAEALRRFLEETPSLDLLARHKTLSAPPEASLPRTVA